METWGGEKEVAKRRKGKREYEPFTGHNAGRPKKGKGGGGRGGEGKKMLRRKWRKNF